ncbi:hypothetical protein BC830DRAFT_1082549 [Chytriomyces sp. MP71]|nr:hypothetical protein BC830DRAFT_1082549 [Chytriomyces sp. MP71]
MQIVHQTPAISTASGSREIQNDRMILGSPTILPLKRKPKTLIESERRSDGRGDYAEGNAAFLRRHGAGVSYHPKLGLLIVLSMVVFWELAGSCKIFANVETLNLEKQRRNWFKTTTSLRFKLSGARTWTPYACSEPRKTFALTSHVWPQQKFEMRVNKRTMFCI